MSYNPHPQCSIDEALIPYKGTQNMPVKHCFKVCVMADAVSGYFCEFNVYVCWPADGVSVETGLGERVVTELTQRLHGKHYQVYCDNLFSTCHRFDELLHQGVYTCGTTCTNRRGYPDTLKGITMEQGEQVFCQQGSLVASVWVDNKPVMMLSTLAHLDIMRETQRKQNDGSRLTVHQA